MSFLGSIVSKVLHPFGGGSEAQAQTADAAPTSSGGSATSSSASSSSPSASSGSAPAGTIDVEKNLSEMAARNPQKLNWKTSIVDLLKLLDLDSSLSARQKLADELNYTGEKDGSAEMNMWLHKQVMHKLEENGGKVPADLKN